VAAAAAATNSEVSVTQRKMEWLVWGGLILTILVVLGAFIILPAKSRTLPMLGRMSDFQLTSQDGQPVTLASLHGEVWIADVIFTRCAGQCPIMSSHMRSVQDALTQGTQIKLVSFTTDPDFDTPSVLKQYAAKFGAHDGEWFFLTGTKPALRNAIVDGLKLACIENSSGRAGDPGSLFVHSAKFVVIDQEGQIRGYFDGETEDGPSQAVAAAQSLVNR
jgi:cytochrome oxidase Cu insertion factor (SCO1/SenC/PrrC family)